jgi:hypothetical protein
LNEFIKIAAFTGEPGMIRQDLAFSCKFSHFRAMVPFSRKAGPFAASIGDGLAAARDTASDDFASVFEPNS